jgi:hypothetical protein
MRYALAIAVIAVAWAAALYVHQRRVTVTYPARTPNQVNPAECSDYRPGGAGSEYCAAFAEPASTVRRHPTWEDPAALLIALGGLAVAVGIVATKPRAKVAA